MNDRPSRRDLIRIGAAAAAGVAAVPQVFAAPSAAIRVRVTAGAKRLAEAPPLAWRAPGASSAEAIVLDPSRAYQGILGFGGAFTDAACANFHRLEPGARDALLRELFGPAGLGLGACRICVGSSDYSSSVYSFDEGEPDPEMRRFSIDHDRGYILPTLAAARAVNRDLYLLASPWSPPGWMKANGSMLGGSMRKPNFAAYARYLAAFLEAYAAAGVPVDALTVQNEVDTDQDGKMPACLWGQEYEIGFIANHLGPELAARKLATKIWVLDHNYNLWGRAVAELDDPKVNRYVDGVAWHGYVGDASAMTRVHEAYPEKHAYWTEGGSDFSDPRYLTNWTHWGADFRRHPAQLGAHHHGLEPGPGRAREAQHRTVFLRWNGNHSFRDPGNPAQRSVLGAGALQPRGRARGPADCFGRPCRWRLPRGVPFPVERLLGGPH